MLSRPQPKIREVEGDALDLADIKGQESAKRALEVAAAGGHNLLMIGPPGAGKSMLAARLPSILPPLSPAELLEVSMIASVAGEIEGGALTNRAAVPRAASLRGMPALVGGGLRARREISLAHNGVLFLDEMSEFSAQALDSLRQPIETGEVANHRRITASLIPRAHAGRGDEPMPLRPRQRARLACRRAQRDAAAAGTGPAVGPTDDRIDLNEAPEARAADSC